MKISRSFSRTIQVKQYEPASFFCAIEEEIADPGEARTTSDQLYEMAKEFVEEDIENFQINDLSKKVEIRLKEAEFKLEQAKKDKTPNIPQLEFEVDFIKLELRELSNNKK